MNILRLVLLGLAAVAALLLSWSFLQQALQAPTSIESGRETPPGSSRHLLAEMHATREKLVATISAAPEYAAFFDRLKTLYPADYESFLSNATKRGVVTGETANADRLLSDAVRTLRLSHGILAAKADTEALNRIFTMQLNVMRALAVADEKLCVDFLYGNASSAFFDFSATHRMLVGDMALAGLAAVADGQAQPVERTAPDDNDFALLDKALREKGLNDAEISAVLDGKMSDPPIEPRRMCRAGQIYLETLAAMPEPGRSRIYGLAVELMARS
ncbi:hypothetical protein [Beijerinckia indica]|uniref:Uncharacterized protein n=1 Tax=Beijerinckia indica subsp. indica (strain ATCC 9039 / DSM 1715 / NCIMB 8712) TaxID=395963 RepID=B2IBX9_BEII9|nr:hypothetical protein [Beijerinckia indica]ACB95237.1 hypothetical protein Bind_1605 [Beijerinckia indica subsp. indica ATCC 9039]